MSLESGKYTITSKLDGAPVGRRLAEPLDTRPKGIFKLPQDMTPPGHATIWEVEKLENGNYTLKARNSIVGAIDGRLFAIIVEDQTSYVATTEWTIKQDERDTEGNAYVVFAAGQGVGWAAPTAGDDEQILVKPILVGLTIPPTYSPSEVFVFQKLD